MEGILIGLLVIQILFDVWAAIGIVINAKATTLIGKHLHLD